MRPEGDEPSDWKEMTRGGWGGKRRLRNGLVSSGVSPRPYRSLRFPPPPHVTSLFTPCPAERAGVTEERR